MWYKNQLSPHVECVILMTYCGDKRKSVTSTMAYSGFGAKICKKRGVKSANFDPSLFGNLKRIQENLI